MNQIKVAVAVVSILLLTACMTYRNLPSTESVESKAVEKTGKNLNYKIEGSAMFAGPNAVRTAINSDSQYSSTSPAEKEPSSGDYLHVQIEQTSPSIPAVAFGYLSLATFTILPFWSTNDGSILTYTLYRDGKTLRTKEYVINRNTFVWIVMLPLAWVNFLTPNEEEAFAACTRDFLKG